MILCEDVNLLFQKNQVDQLDNQSFDNLTHKQELGDDAVQTVQWYAQHRAKNDFICLQLAFIYGLI